MSQPDPLPDAAREHAWRLLWQRLLQEPPGDDEPKPSDTESDEERSTEAA